MTLLALVNGSWTAAYSTVDSNGSLGATSAPNPLFVSSENTLGYNPGYPGYLGNVFFESFLYPLNGATNVDPFKPFVWLLNGWFDGSTLTVGTSPGASDVFNSGTLADTQLSHPAADSAGLQVPGLQPNTTYWAQIVGPALVPIQKGGGRYNTPSDIQFATGTGKAHLITPTDEAQQVSVTSPVTFTCNAVQDAQQYVLWLGTSPGGTDVAQGWPGLATSETIPLQPNQIYYARMWTQKAGQWTYVDSRFSTYSTDVAFVDYPAPGELHADSGYILGVTQNGNGVPETGIGWKILPDATGWAMWVGTSRLANDLGVASLTYGSVGEGLAVVEPPPNGTYYVTLWTQKGSQWYATESEFSTFPQTPTSQFGSDPQ